MGRVRDRDDACPGTIDAAVGDDGLIARVRLPGGRLTAAQASELALCAEDLGTGSVDLTVRANAQLRGLDDAGLRTLAARLSAAGLLPSPAHDRVRNILAGPFAGRDRGALVDAARIVEILDAALCADPELAALPGRFQFAVDDGALRVASRRHDVALVAAAEGTAALHVAGTDTGLRAHSPEASADLALAAARAFLRLRGPSGAWHVRELPGGPAQLACAVRLDPAMAAYLTGRSAGQPAPTGTGSAGPVDPSASGAAASAKTRPTGPVVGIVPQADGRAALSVVAPLGRVTARQLRALANVVGPADDTARLRIAPWRGVVVTDVPWDEAPALLDGLAAAGLAVSPDSPWLRVTACSGLGECRRARTDIRLVARKFAAHGLSAGGEASPAPELPVHFAACERACGRPAGAALVVARDGVHDDAPGRAPDDAPDDALGNAPGGPVVPRGEVGAGHPGFAVSADQESGAAWTRLTTALQPVLDSVAGQGAAEAAAPGPPPLSPAPSTPPTPPPSERHPWTTG
ncbi:precorrin-3B synthase [Yinghuangia soli]|uniref:Precorrin-3B synthase n=1 Tax=Yinghuangia soli TaxID=2908204 RepID=A0AA41Q1I4_9ACTN|nr:precorrin-3B synthase [Yinghuangia soli]MCF2529586.1 precorrin-3B synthase [Yinghuangia soli]